MILLRVSPRSGEALSRVHRYEHRGTAPEPRSTAVAGGASCCTGDRRRETATRAALTGPHR